MTDHRPTEAVEAVDAVDGITGDDVLVADQTGAALPAAGGDGEPVRTLWSDAWREMRHRPLFWVALALILLVVTMAAFPSLFTARDPLYCQLSDSRLPPSAEHIFGTDTQGCDVYARTIYGARASVLVGVFTTLVCTLIGGFIGTVSAFYGGFLDTLLSRVGEIFFAIPTLLGGIVILYSLPNEPNSPFLLVVGKVVLALSVLGWPSLARIMRSSVLQVKPHDYVQAARALGASPWRIITSHILPNAVAPVTVVATINLGVYIAVEATLSFLGIGLQPPAISWGIAISEASGIGYITAAPHMLLFPSLFLSLTVLAFIMLGEVVRDALDPKLR
ncbi:MAG TPA: ABC transporter permease [Propionibacteriaceae bacterium]|nr:ABC transporter permease [Propionibacteriaceae bacterium]HQE32637.1 ABC transporter permease [Propionibacteriaceae bacterium]